MVLLGTIGVCGLLTGTLVPLLGIGGLAVYVNRHTRRAGVARHQDVHERELDTLWRAIQRVEENTLVARENLARAQKIKRGLGKARVTAARRELRRVENDPATGDFLRQELHKLKNSSEPKELRRDLEVSANLYGWATLFQPLLAIPILGGRHIIDWGKTQAKCWQYRHKASKYAREYVGDMIREARTLRLPAPPDTSNLPRGNPTWFPVPKKL